MHARWLSLVAPGTHAPDAAGATIASTKPRKTAAVISAGRAIALSGSCRCTPAAAAHGCMYGVKNVPRQCE